MTGIVRRLLGSTRHFILVAVVGSFIASAAALVYGGVATVAIAVRTFAQPDFSGTGAKLLAVDLLTMTDLFLLGTVLYIVSVGLYELFVDDRLPMPGWLRITTLDDLTERLLGLVTVLLAVTFVGSAVTWAGGTDIVALGVAIASVVGVVTITIAMMVRARLTARDDQGSENR